MALPNIDGLCQYGRIPRTGNDMTLALCLDAACTYMADSGVPVEAQYDPQYELGVYMLALHYYDHRGVIDDAAAELPHGLMSIIHHLRY